jgi:hypothetical protein
VRHVVTFDRLRLLAQHPLQFTDLLERIVPPGSHHRSLTRQAAVLIQLAPQEQLVGIGVIAPSHHRNNLLWFKTLANQGNFFASSSSGVAAPGLKAPH